MSKTHNKYLFEPTALAISLLLPLSAYADETQPAAQAKAVELETVNVISKRDNKNLIGRTYGYQATESNTATKTQIPLNQTARSVSVITRQQIEDQRPATISESLNYSAGAFTGLVGAATRYDYVAMRGFNENMTDNILVDGQKLLSDSNTYSSMQIDPYFIERVDMLKGPASAVYGRATPGGVVAATTKRPLHDSYHEINLFGGSREHLGVSFDLTDNLNESGSAAYRLTGLFKRSDSQNEGHKSQRFAIMPSVSWNITPDTHLLLQSYIQNDPDAGYHSGLPAEGMVYPKNGFTFPRSFSDSEPSDYFKRRQNLYSYQLTHQLNPNWQIQSKFRYAEVHTRNQQTWNLGWADDQNLARSGGKTVEHLRSYAGDNHIKGHFETGALKHELIAGVDYQQRKTTADAAYNFSSIPLLNVYQPVYSSSQPVFNDYASNQTYRLKQLGIYLQDQIRLGNWIVNGGLRHDRVDTTATDNNSGSVSKWKGGKTTWQTSALYAFENGISPYLSYSTGFNPNTYVDQSGNLLEPTTSRQWETGIKYQPAGTLDLYTLSVYDLRQDNVANRVINGNYYIPAGRIKSRGVELEAKSQITPNWFLQGALTYNHVRFADNSGAEAELNGKTPYQAPKWMASLWTNYKFDTGLNVHAGIRHINGIWADHRNTVKLPSYTLVDLGVRYDLGRLVPSLQGLQTSISVNNLFNRRYVSSCAGIDYCYYGEGRNVLANVSYRW